MRRKHKNRMTKGKPVTKLPPEMRESIQVTSELVDRMRLIERRYLLGVFTADVYYTTMRDALVGASVRLVR